MSISIQDLSNDTQFFIHVAYDSLKVMINNRDEKWKFSNEQEKSILVDVAIKFSKETFIQIEQKAYRNDEVDLIDVVDYGAVKNILLLADESSESVLGL
jgi:hypothetical protein